MHVDRKEESFEMEDLTFLLIIPIFARISISEATTFDVSFRIWRATIARKEFRIPKFATFFLLTWIMTFKRKFDRWRDSFSRTGSFSKAK